MKPKSQDIHHAEEVFGAAGGMMRTSEATRAGIQYRTLYWMRDNGLLLRVTRGVYRLASLPGLTQPDLAAVSMRVPNCTICLISALDFHDLTSEIPRAVDIALPKGASTPRIEYPPIRVYRFSGLALSEGVETYSIDGVPVRVYGPAKTVADCFKYRNKLGIEVPLEALKMVLRRRLTTPAELMRFAEICRVAVVMRPYLEALL